MSSIFGKSKNLYIQTGKQYLENAGLQVSDALFPGADALGTAARERPSIDGFMAKMRNGFSHPNLFQVFISPPADVVREFRALGYDFELVNLLCHSFNSPNTTIQTSKMSSHNTTFNIATGIDLDSVSGTWHVDSQNVVLKFFEIWNNTIIDQYDTWTLNYADNYRGQITLIIYDREMDRQMEYIFHNAYPINKAGIEFSAENSDQITSLPVSFSYDWYTVKPLDVVSASIEILKRSQALAAGIQAVSSYAESAVTTFNNEISQAIDAAKNFDVAGLKKKFPTGLKL
jgi:hypothetical protein